MVQTSQTAGIRVCHRRRQIQVLNQSAGASSVTRNLKLELKRLSAETRAFLEENSVSVRPPVSLGDVTFAKSPRQDCSSLRNLEFYQGATIPVQMREVAEIRARLFRWSSSHLEVTAPKTLK